MIELNPEASILVTLLGVPDTTKNRRLPIVSYNDMLGLVVAGLLNITIYWSNYVSQTGNNKII